METIVYFTPWQWHTFTTDTQLQHIVPPFFWLLVFGGDVGGLSGGFQSLNGGFE